MRLDLKILRFLFLSLYWLYLIFSPILVIGTIIKFFKAIKEFGFRFTMIFIVIPIAWAYSLFKGPEFIFTNEIIKRVYFEVEAITTFVSSVSGIIYCIKFLKQKKPRDLIFAFLICLNVWFLFYHKTEGVIFMFGDPLMAIVMLLVFDFTIIVKAIPKEWS